MMVNPSMVKMCIRDRYWVSADLDAATFGLQEGILYIQKLDKELTTGGREEAITLSLIHI